MWRALAAIVAAFKLANPSLPAAVADGYAQTVQADAKKHRYDPFTTVAITWHESRVNSRIVKEVDGETYVGLGQIRLRNFGDCRDDMQSAGCAAIKARLLTGSENLVAIGAIIASNRAYCVKRHGRAPFAGWLALYQGYDTGCSTDPKKIPRMTWRVMNYRKWLLATVPRHMRGLSWKGFQG